MKILLIKQTSLGDVIHATLALEAIRRQWPQAEIHFMVDRACYPVLQFNPHIQRFFFYEHQRFRALLRQSKRNLPRMAQAIKALIKEIRQQEYDLAIDLQGIERSALFLYAARAKAKFIKGRKKPLLKNFRNPDRNDHALMELRGTLALAGIDASADFPRIYSAPDAEFSLNRIIPGQIRQILQDDKRQLVLISPFTSWSTKNVPLSTWLQSIRQLADARPQCCFAFIATAEHKAGIDRAIKKVNLPETIKQRIYNLAGLTNLQQLISLIKMADVLMCSEGAAGHIASAVNTPVVVVFGPTRPSRVGPWGSLSRIVQKPDIQCLACYKRSCQNWICMLAIETRISKAAAELLGRRN